MKNSLISNPIRTGIMAKLIISSPIIAYMMVVRTIVCATICPVMIRYAEVEQAGIRIIDINPEVPASSIDIQRSVEIISTQESTVLRFTEYPTKVIVANIQRFVIVVHRPFFTSHYIIHNVTDRVDEIIIYLISIIILRSI